MKDIVGYEGLYGIEEDGRVWSYKRECYLIPVLKNKYYSINIYKDKIRTPYYIHRLIAIAYIPNPDNKPFIDHINRIRTDNRIENLRWVTQYENGQNLSLFKTNTTGEKNIIYCNTHKRFMVKIERYKLIHKRTFKTLQEAIDYRDNYLTPTTQS